MPRRAEKILTDTGVRNLRRTGRRYEVRDAARPGFGVRVEADGRKVFFQRFGSRGERRLILGTYSKAFSLAEARAAAERPERTTTPDAIRSWRSKSAAARFESSRAHHLSSLKGTT
jgi:Arm DNA-binding domain